MRAIFICLLLHVSGVIIAQTDTVRIAQYNLLNYGNSANQPAYKDPRLSTILQHIDPDILGVNEVFSDSTLLDRLRDSVLGPDWKRGSFYNTAGQTQVSALFWRSSLFTLRSTTLITAQTRDIVAYQLRYNDTVTVPHDTAFLTCIVAHLKAGTSSAEDATRAGETAQIAEWLYANKPASYIMQGDLNVYDSDDSAYQLLTNHPTYGAILRDPINRPGDWHDDSGFADIHTQSPRQTTIGDGGVGGGLDDRFDQILVNDGMMQDTAAVRVLPATYRAVGQDGLHPNASLTSPPENNAAPANVIQALYEMSDHLPVAVDIVVQITPVTATTVAAIAGLQSITVSNPAHGALLLHGVSAGQQLRITVYDPAGRCLLQSAAVAGGRGDYTSAAQGITGLHLVEIADQHGGVLRKMVMFQ